MDTIPNGHDLEWAQFRMYTIPNCRNHEWTQSRMGAIPNGHNILNCCLCMLGKDFYSTYIVTEVLFAYAFYKDAFIEKLIFCVRIRPQFQVVVVVVC